MKTQKAKKTTPIIGYTHTHTHTHVNSQGWRLLWYESSASRGCAACVSFRGRSFVTLICPHEHHRTAAQTWPASVSSPASLPSSCYARQLPAAVLWFRSPSESVSQQTTNRLRRLESSGAEITAIRNNNARRRPAQPPVVPPAWRQLVRSVAVPAAGTESNI